MSMRKMFVTMFFMISTFILIQSAWAQDIHITDIYSDIDSADITVHSDKQFTDISITADMMFNGKVLQSRDLLIEEIAPDTDVTKVFSWDLNIPERGSYRTRMILSMDGSILETSYSNFSYGWGVIPKIFIKDIVPDSSGMSVILAPYTTQLVSEPVLADVEYMLVDGDTVISRTTDRRVTVVQATPLSKNWNVRLENNHDYSTRVKVRTLSPRDIVIAKSEDFTSMDDARITELFRDETGASATVDGFSQVPFTGNLIFTVTKGGDLIEEVEEISPILMYGDDETIEVIWSRKLASGIYELTVKVVGNDGDILDTWDTVIESDYDSSSDAPPVSTPTQTPGFGIVPATFVLLVLSLIFGRKDRRDG